MFGSAEFGSIGPYRILQRLGVESTCEVFLGIRKFPSGFERRVVIKRLLTPSDFEPEQHQVLAAEALAYTRVAHPAIVQMFDVLSIEGNLALVLEHVDGPSLARLLSMLEGRHERISDACARYIAARVFAGLAAAHAARDPQTGEVTPVIHRDVSPDNVRVPWDGFVKLGDFNIAKVIGVSGDTRAGLLKGTYGYMAPEQVLGEPVTPRTDVFAGCLLLRELLLGRPAFPPNLPELELLRAMSEAQLEPLETLRGGISRRLATALQRGLARDPEQRTLTAAEMVQVLRAEIDMDAAHQELTAMLTRIRWPEARPSVPGRESTPTSISGVTLLPAAIDVAPLSSPRRSYEDTVRIALQPPWMQPWTRLAKRVRPLAAAAAVAGIAAVAGLVSYLLPPSAAPVTAVASATPPAEVEAAAAEAERAPAPAAPPPATPAITPAATLGELVLPPSARHHRVILDGRQIAPSSSVLRIPCGRHTIRIGSAGAVQTVLVPCGGTLAVDGR